MNMAEIKEAKGKITEAREKGILLYLVGVSHIFGSPPVDDLVKLIEPDVILMEGCTPSSTYSKGIATGEFEDELNDPRLVWQVPNLHSIKETVDSLDCFVSGWDLSREEKDRLESNLTSERLERIYNGMTERVYSILYEKTPKSMSTEEYRALEGIYSKLDDIEVGINDINHVLYGCIELAKVIEPNQELLSRRFGREVEAFRRFKEEADSYLQVRETSVFDTMNKHYDGNKRILILSGGAHFEDSSYLIKAIEEKRIPYLRLDNNSS
ncbi:hypothetical protein KY360_06985 [Candidatus Woesearchaeota archaeon]|nr:hypothetical protein [Candidatus Woesearchaeota archaeon]